MKQREGIGIEDDRESVSRRHGENLYPSRLNVEFGEQKLSLDVPEGVWNPTPHGIQLGHALVELDLTGQNVLELGTGCGLHAILLARAGSARLTVTEIERLVLDNALHNLKKHKIQIPVDPIVADWTNVSGGPFDVLVSNPPFAKAGKRYRRYFIDTLVLDAHRLVRPGGRLIFIQSSMADIPRSIALMEECGMTVRILRERDQAFRDYYFEDALFRKEMASIPAGYTVRDGVHHERLIVFEAQLP